MFDGFDEDDLDEDDLDEIEKEIQALLVLFHTLRRSQSSSSPAVTEPSPMAQEHATLLGRLRKVEESVGLLKGSRDQRVRLAELKVTDLRAIVSDLKESLASCRRQREGGQLEKATKRSTVGPRGIIPKNSKPALATAPSTLTPTVTSAPVTPVSPKPKTMARRPLDEEKKGAPKTSVECAGEYNAYTEAHKKRIEHDDKRSKEVFWDTISGDVSLPISFPLNPAVNVCLFSTRLGKLFALADVAVLKTQLPQGAEMEIGLSTVGATNNSNFRGMRIEDAVFALQDKETDPFKDDASVRNMLKKAFQGDDEFKAADLVAQVFVPALGASEWNLRKLMQGVIRDAVAEEVFKTETCGQALKAFENDKAQHGEMLVNTLFPYEPLVNCHIFAKTGMFVGWHQEAGEKVATDDNTNTEEEKVKKDGNTNPKDEKVAKRKTNLGSQARQSSPQQVSYVLPTLEQYIQLARNGPNKVKTKNTLSGKKVKKENKPSGDNANEVQEERYKRGSKQLALSLVSVNRRKCSSLKEAPPPSVGV